MYADLLNRRPPRWRARARAAWRESLLRPWKRSRPAFVAAAAAIVVACGMVGFSHVEVGSSTPSVLDNLYRSLQLFALGGGNATTPDVYLQIARFLGPAVVGYAAVGAVLALYREQLNLFWASRQRHHVVVAGLGASGARLASAFVADGWPVVAIERDPANPAIEACRDRGMRVLVGDASDPRALRHAAGHHAALVVALCGDDKKNMDVAAAARRTAQARRGAEVLTTLVNFDNFDLWYVMKAQALVDREQSAFRLELVNVPALGSDLLLEAHPPFPAAGPGSPKLCVVSEGARADSLVEGILRRWQAAGRAPEGALELTLVGTEGAFSQLFVRHPGLGDVPGAKLSSAFARQAGAASLAGALDAGASTVYIDLADETEALTVAIAARERCGYDPGHRVVIAVEDDSAGVAQAVGHGGPAMQGISVFGRASRALRPGALLENTATEVIARLGHEHHCEHQRSQGLTAGEDPSLAGWDDLPPALRHSNRLWADGIAAKLAKLDCAVVPAAIGPEKAPFCFRADEVEALAPLEHQRWNTDMKRMGYRQGPRDDSHHPLIDVPFDELPEANKDKDREHVRAIPVVLARAGFEVRRTQGR